MASILYWAFLIPEGGLSVLVHPCQISAEGDSGEILLEVSGSRGRRWPRFASCLY